LSLTSASKILDFLDTLFTISISIYQKLIKILFLFTEPTTNTLSPSKIGELGFGFVYTNPLGLSKDLAAL